MKSSIHTWRIFVSFILIFLAGHSSFAQMSGTYYIGAGAGSDFESFQEAVDSLESQGVNGPVNILADAGTYNEQVEIVSIAGASETNTITFQSASGDSTDVELTYEAVEYDANYVVQLYNSEHITFKHLTIHPTGTTYGRGITLEGAANNITFSHCRFKGHYMTINRNRLASIFSMDQLPDSLYFHNNLFDSVTIAIYLRSNNDKVINDVEILNNNFRDIGYQAIYFSRISGGTIDNNRISGCYIAILNSTSYSNAVITNNRIISKRIGINYTSVQYLPESGLIANNHIFISDDAGQCRGLSIGGSSPVNIYHNTVILGDGGLDDYALYINNFPVNDAMNVINNILACQNEGVPFNNDYQLCPVETLDYNCYYTAGKFIGRDNGKWLFNLEDLRNQFGQDQHSFSAYPVFSPDTSVYPLTARINNKGTPLPSVNTDIDGESRDVTHPDVGAVEYTPPAYLTTPYAGDYTVGPGEDFDSLAQAIDSLLIKGVSSEVRLNFSSGTHIVHTEIPTIPGTDYDKHLVLQSESGNRDDVLIKYEKQSNHDNAYVIKCQGTDFMTVRNLSFKADRDEGFFSDFSRVFRFFGGTENLTFTGNYLKSVYHPTSEHYSIFFTNEQEHYYDSLVIAGNILDSCGVGIYLDNYGYYQDKNKPIKLHILDNKFSHIGHEGVYLLSHNSPTIKNNVIDSEIGAMTLSNCINNTTITGNQIFSRFDYAIGIMHCDAVNSSRGLIANNFITITGNSDSKGITIVRSENYDIVYNSVHMISDHVGSHAFYISHGEGLVVMNNIFTNVGGGYVAKYYDVSSAIDSMDFNDYYTTGNNLAVWESTVCSDLGELQSASGMDQHSLSVDPGFVSDDDLHLNSPAVTEHATPIPFVTTDIDGATRDTLTPDIGADEYGAFGNQPPELVNPIADWTIEEDSDTTAIARLDTVFADPDPGDDLYYTVVSDTSSVKAFVIDTVLKVKPDTNFYGLAAIIVSASDPSDEMASDTFNITISNVQDPPVAVDDWVNTQVNTYVDVDVLHNDFDVDGDTLKITHATDGSNGTSGVLAGYVTIRYTPDPEFVGKDTISYGIRDGHGNYDTASVYLTVSFVREGFVVTDLALDSISHASVAWGDYDADGDLDLLMTGWLGSNSEYITKIYQNNDGVLEDTEMNLQGVMAGSDKSCGWTDFNNDGLLDFIITGAKDGQPDEFVTMLYKQVEGTFVEMNLRMHGVTSGSVDWGDYDHDGDYDLLINGKGSGSEYAGIYINNINTDNDFEYNNYGFEPVWSSAANWGDFDGDGDLDVLSSGLGATKSQYRNDLPGFSNVQSVLNSIQGRTADVGDFDMDGDLDIVMAGDNADTAYSCIFECVTHEDPATWAYSLKSNIQNIKSGSVAWGDYDNDGDLDLIVSGTKTGLESHTVLYENHEGSFWPEEAGFPDLGRSAAAWADYDNDGDLDLLLTGWGEDGPVSAIFRNNRARTNTPPEAPEALAVEAGMDSVRLIWSTGSDNETAQKGLTYNLRMGTSPGGSQIISPLSMADGFRQVPKMGNAGLDTSYIVYGLQPSTTYYWSVQSVDNCFAGSSFAEEQSFTTSTEDVPDNISSIKQNELKVYPNPTNGLLKIELGEDRRVEMLKVLNITGTEVVSKMVNGRTMTLDLSGHPDGVYLIRAVGEKDISIARIVKIH